jgi:hypothetical protein
MYGLEDGVLIKKIFIILLLLISIPQWSWAAIDCDKTTLEAAIASASDGATITCNAGTIAYTEAAAIDLSAGKALPLREM